MSIENGFDFQDIVQKRIGFGKYQIMVVVCLIIVQITDGIQAIAVSLVTPILKRQLHLTLHQVSLFTSVFHIGVGAGAIVSGILSSIHGRKPALIGGLIIQLVSGFALALKLKFGLICVFRMLYGVGFGSTIAVSSIIATECLTIQLRGKGLLIINALNSFGKLIGVGLAFIFLKGQIKQSFQYMLCSVVFSLLGLILSCIFVKQSYRFLLSKHKNQQAYQIMDEIILMNTKDQSNFITEQEKQNINQWSSKTFDYHPTNSNTIQLICQEKKKISLFSLCWFLVAFITFGQLFIVPFMVGSEGKGLIKYFWMTLGEVPSIFLTYLLIEKQGFGRKNTLVLLCCLGSFLCIFVVLALNSFTLFLAKMIIKASIQMLYPFTSESYSTNIRSIAFSLNSVFGRVGSAIMPFILYPLYLNYSNSPFMLLSLLSFIAAIYVFCIKDDTRMRPLDEAKEQRLIQEEQIEYEIAAN